MVKLGESSGNITAKDAVNSFSRHSDKFKNIRAVQINSKYKVPLRKGGKVVQKLVAAGSAEDASRIALRQNKSATSTGIPKLWRKQFVVYGDPK